MKRPSMNLIYHPQALVRIGGRHLSQSLNGQDHAIVGHHDRAVVLVVADGVSTYYDRNRHQLHGRNEVASWLAAEVALSASLSALDKDVAPERVVDDVALALHGAFHPLWRALGLERGQIGLMSTLLLAIVTPTWTGIYASGDGYWGVTLPVWEGSAPPDTGIVKGEALVDVLRPDGVGVFGSQTGLHVKNLATIQARLDAKAVRDGLRPVLLCPQPVLAVHIATDGLEDEQGLLTKLRRGPCRHKDEVEEALKRPKDSDDLAVAWTFTRFPGMLGEAELPVHNPALSAMSNSEVAHG